MQKKPVDTRILWGIAFVLLTTLIWLAFFWEPPVADAERTSPPHNALQMAGTPAGGDFILRGPEGNVALADQRGKVVILYFGYTFCPDVCPTSLALLAQALSSLTPEELRQVRGFFISVDPERDTPDVLKIYVPFFHPALAGLSGTPAEIAQVARQYGARYMKQKARDGAPYTVDHSSYTYIISPDGKLAATLPHGTDPREIIAAIRKLLPAPSRKETP